MSKIIPFRPYFDARNYTNTDLDFLYRLIYIEMITLECEKNIETDPELKLDLAEQLYEAQQDPASKAIIYEYTRRQNSKIPNDIKDSHR